MRIIRTTLATLTLLACAGAFAQETKPKPRVALETSKGRMVLELEPDAAPATVKNFLGYVRKGFYKGTVFHRVIPAFMIQGGGLTPDLSKKPTGKAIPHEGEASKAAGLSNVKYSLAMARTNDPHSATSQFFINTVDNPRLDFTEKTERGYGYVVFGKVVEGTEVVDQIRDVKTGVRKGMPDVPTETVLIKSATVVGEEKPAPKAAKGKTKPKK